MKVKNPKSFLAKVVKTAVYLVCIFSLMTTVFISPSLADDCGKSDRVAVPACVDIQTQSNAWRIANKCSHPVTLKFDQSGSDKRPTISPSPTASAGGLYFYGTYKRDAKISCCPRYNSCENN